MNSTNFVKPPNRNGLTQENDVRKSNEKREGARVLNDWLDYSSFHGIVDISRPGYGKAWKCAWVFLMLGFTALTVYSIMENVQDFIEKPTMQEYTEHRQSQFNMPDILICTHQRFNISRLKRMGASEELINGIVSYSSLNLDGVTTVLNSLSNPDPRAEDSKRASIRRQYEQFLRQNGNPGFDALLKNASVDCAALIQYCSWTSNCCAPEVARPVLTLQYGQCYRLSTSNPAFSKSPIQHWPGPGSGLQMVVKGDLREQHWRLKSSVVKGVLLDVAYPNESMAYAYHQIPAGVSATVHLSLQRTQRMNLPFREPVCRDMAPRSWADSPADMIEAMKSTANGCYYVIWATTTAKYCNCNPMAAIYLTDGSGEKIPACHPFQLDNCSRFDESMEETRRLQQESCLQQCDRYEYKVSISYSDFAIDLYDETWGKLNDSSANRIDKDSIFLDIYHPNMEYVHVREAETYSPITLISNIGGAAGLWLGASLMSFFQAIMYLAKWASLRRSNNGVGP